MQRIRTRTTFILLVMVNLTISLIAAQSWAETPVIGFIAQDTTWTQANGPYVTLGNIIVKEGVTLTIEPGVTIQFDSGHSLTIEGRLIARGTDKQGINFTTKGDKEPEVMSFTYGRIVIGEWGGILFEDSSIDTKFDDVGNYVSGSILQYCTVKFAETAVKANSASPFIDHCVISNNVSRGIFISNGDNVVIQNSIIADNTGGGISLESNRSVITGNSLIGNTVKEDVGDAFGGGIYVKGGTATISNNTLTENTTEGGFGGGGGGIYVEGSIAIISNNILIGNAAISGEYFGYSWGGGICVKGGTVTISNNILIGNTIGRKSAFGGGIYVKNGNATISNNTLTGNTVDGKSAFGGGIYVEGGITTISSNTITENRVAYSADSVYTCTDVKAGGTAIYYKGNEEITGNFIANNLAEEKFCWTDTVYIDGNPTFTENAIIGNQTEYNLYYAQSKGAPNLNATNNYWGVTTEAEIRVKIYDVFADKSKAIVDVVPFLVENPLPLGSLAVVASPKALPADGKSTATITATLKDSKGKPVLDEPLTMVVSQGTGKLSEVKNNGDGTYTATYTASRTVDSEIIWVAAPKSRLAKSIEIQLTEPSALLPRWDVNEDGVVNISDLVLVGQYFEIFPPKDSRVDVNEDGNVDILDLVLVGKHFGENTE